jgi:hypothetical protein
VWTLLISATQGHTKKQAPIRAGERLLGMLHHSGVANRRTCSKPICTKALRALLLIAVAAGSSAARAQAPSKLQRQYESQSDPVRKAKTLAKLGPEEIDHASAFIQAGDEARALSALEYYRKACRNTVDALLVTKVDLSRHPGGFKDLQIGLRVTIRRLDDLIFSLPADDRPRFLEIEAGLSAAQTDLFQALFPPANARDVKDSSAKKK